MQKVTYPVLPQEITVLNYQGDLVLVGNINQARFQEIKASLPIAMQSRVIGWKLSFGAGRSVTIH